MRFILTIIVVLVLWSLWGYFSSKVEQADYEVLSVKNGYEIRSYPSRIVAQTTVSGSYDDALSEGFRIIANYIFGGNVKKKGIAMTAPVVESSAKSDSEKITMTAPVTESTKGDSHVITFGMPKNYTKDSLPEPTDSRVKIVVLPAQKFAVMKFSWFRTSERISKMKQELVSKLEKDGVAMVGNPSYAGYNAPWTPPWMSRHEVLVELK